MPCKKKTGNTPVCVAGKCQCAKKSGIDSPKDAVKMMKERLSGSIIDIPIEGKNFKHRAVHFGKAAQYVVKHFGACMDSAKTHLRTFHFKKHLRLFPNADNPTHVVFETVPID